MSQAAVDSTEWGATAAGRGRGDHGGPALGSNVLGPTKEFAEANSRRDVRATATKLGGTLLSARATGSRRRDSTVPLTYESP